MTRTGNGKVRREVPPYTLHVERCERGWHMRRQNADRAMKVLGQRDAMILHARAVVMKKRGVLYVHQPDGTIESRESYVASSAPPIVAAMIARGAESP